LRDASPVHAAPNEREDAPIRVVAEGSFATREFLAATLSSRPEVDLVAVRVRL
jgi:hypothetical protein